MPSKKKSSKKKSSSVSLSPDTWQIIYVVVGVAIVGTLVWFFCRPPPPRSSFSKTTDRTCKNRCVHTLTGIQCGDRFECVLNGSEWRCTDSQGSCNVNRQCLGSPTSNCMGERGYQMCIDDDNQGLCKRTFD